MQDDFYIKERAEIEKHLALLEEQRLENHKMWDSQILSLTTLILGLSLTILNEFIDINTACYNYLIKISWFFLWATIVSAIINFYVSEKAQLKWQSILIKIAKHFNDINYSTNKLNSKLKEIELSGELKELKKERDEGINEISAKIDEHDTSLAPMNRSHGRWNSAIERLNLVKTISFIIALTLMVLYVYFNL